jgi:hypothetical protein
MAYREQLIAACTDKAKALGRKLGSMEIVELACECHTKASKERKRAEVLPDAEQIYALYPKKVGKEEALRAISKALKTNSLEYLLGKTNQFKECVESWPMSYRYFQDGGDRCPHPASWFNAGRYSDDPREWKRHGARSAPPNKIAPPEPKDWQQAFPDFVDRDKPWHMLQPAQQAWIVANMATAAHFSEPIEQDAQQTILRQA